MVGFALLVSSGLSDRPYFVVNHRHRVAPKLRLPARDIVMIAILASLSYQLQIVRA